MTATAFQLATDSDERAELLEYGVVLSDTGAIETPDAQCQIDASASQLMRAILVRRQDLERYAHACAEEHALVQARYERASAKLTDQIARLESIVRQYAQMSDFPGKKSRELTWGTYGMRSKPDAFTITDDAAVLAWAKQQPAPVRTALVSLTAPKPKERVLQAAAQKHFAVTGEIPAGCEFTPKHEEAFVTVATPEEAAS